MVDPDAPDAPSNAIPRGLLPDTAAVAGDGSLTIGGCSLDALAAEFGTPLFVYDEAHLRNRCREAVAALARLRSTKSCICLSFFCWPSKLAWWTASRCSFCGM